MTSKYTKEQVVAAIRTLHFTGAHASDAHDGQVLICKDGEIVDTRYPAPPRTEFQLEVVHIPDENKWRVKITEHVGHGLDPRERWSDHFDEFDHALDVAHTNLEAFRTTYGAVNRFLEETAGPVDPEYLDRVAERRKEKNA